jgi:hypothetical protein
LLRLGNALGDQTPVGRMRDSSALQLFSLRNWLICADNGRFTESLNRLPWSLQEEGMRNPGLPRGERLGKAILSLKLLRARIECQQGSARA